VRKIRSLFEPYFMNIISALTAAFPASPLHHQQNYSATNLRVTLTGAKDRAGTTSPFGYPCSREHLCAIGNQLVDGRKCTDDSCFVHNSSRLWIGTLCQRTFIPFYQTMSIVSLDHFFKASKKVYDFII